MQYSDDYFITEILAGGDRREKAIVQFHKQFSSLIKKGRLFMRRRYPNLPLENDDWVYAYDSAVISLSTGLVQGEYSSSKELYPLLRKIFYKNCVELAGEKRRLTIPLEFAPEKQEDEDNALEHIIHSEQILQRFLSGHDWSKKDLVEYIVSREPFTLREWMQLLDLPEKRLRQYLQTKESLGRVRSAQLLEILLILRRGLEVFEDEERFLRWLSAKSIALGGVAPKELLDNSFGIQLVRDELGRIEYGILA